MISLPSAPLADLAARVADLVNHHVPFAAPAAPTTDSADIVLRSSGTTTAKSVGHTYAAVEWAANAANDALGAHDWRWLLVLSPVSAGGFMTIARSQRPALVWPGIGGRFAADDLMAWYPGGCQAVSLVSTQLARLLDTPGGVAMLRGLEAVLIGGGPLHDALRQRCVDEGITLVHTYGATETLGGCVYDGLPWTGVDVAVIDGQIHIDGPNVAASYVPGPALAHPWPTGDLGQWMDGRLHVQGRADDQVTVKGVNRSLREYEAAALSRPGVIEAVAVAVPDEADGYRVEVFVEDDAHRLPRLETGKPDRQELLRRARGDSR